MTVGVVGTGRMGLALAEAVSAAAAGPVILAATRTGSGHPVPDGCRPVELATLWRDADLVFLALPFAVALDLLSAGTGRAGYGRTLVDVTNPRFATNVRLSPGLSGGELIARAAPTWQVAKAFNTIPAALLRAARLGGRPPSLPVAGHRPAKADVFTMARRLRFEPLDAGGIADSGDLESLAVLLRRIADAHGMAGNVACHIGTPHRPLTPAGIGGER